MSETQLTRHAIARMAQRGFRDDDHDLIRLIGTQVEDGYLVRDRDYQAAERELKLLLERVRRLNGKRLVIAAGRIVTAYPAGEATKRRLIREAEERELAG